MFVKCGFMHLGRLTKGATHGTLRQAGAATSLSVATLLIALLAAAYFAMAWAGWDLAAFLMFALFFGLVCATLVGEFIAYDLIYCLTRASDKLKKDRRRRRACTKRFSQ